MINENGSLCGITKHDPNGSMDMFRNLDITKTNTFLKMFVVLDTASMQKWLKYIIIIKSPSSNF
jgi:hypothetical protein